MLDVDGAYLLGLLAADGHVQTEIKNGVVQGYKVSVNCGNAPGDEEFSRHVTEVMAKVWGVPVTNRLVPRVPPRVPYWSPTVYRKSAVDWVKGLAGDTSTHEWSIPGCVLHSDVLLAAWISGLTDGDGSVVHAPPRRFVSIASANQEGLTQVISALKRLGIRASGPYPRSEEDDRSNILICDRRSLEAFRDKIGVRQPEKRRKLDEAIGSYKRGAPNLLASEVSDLAPEVLKRRAAGEGFAEIAKTLGLASAEIPKGLIKRLAKKHGGMCVICATVTATHSVPRVIKGRSSKYVCEPCLDSIEPNPEWLRGMHKFALSEVAEFLDKHHYLGRRSARIGTGFALRDRVGVMTFSTPQASQLPRDWLELSRWCIPGGSPPNAGSSQWADAKKWLLENTKVTTIVSYSDPSRHDGALYRASGWLWAPSSQFLLKNLQLTGERHPEKPYHDKNRWVYALRPDPRRSESLTVRHPWLYSNKEFNFLCDWVEPRWKRGVATGGGKDYKRWLELLKSRASKKA